eukprot:COSAG02_NODE_31363_length_535_cov_0.623853_1_plen_47_part_10
MTMRHGMLPSNVRTPLLKRIRECSRDSRISARGDQNWNPELYQLIAE